MPYHHTISPAPLSLEQIERLLAPDSQASLSNESRERIVHCRAYLDQQLDDTDRPFYGINTGFGALHNIRISPTESEVLQENLVKSHACGTGDLVPVPVARLLLFLKIQNLSYGHSGVRLALVERLLELYNRNIVPVIFQQGSLGASGDLAPLAHMSLPLIGEGEVYWKGERQATAEVWAKLGWHPMRLKAKEGLALLNGTQFSTAYGAWAAIQGRRLLALSNACAALSIDAFTCHTSPFDDRIHQIRPQTGQIAVAAQIRALLAGSELMKKEKLHVQDPYAFRCVPQVHGASADAIDYVSRVLTTEVNSVTDNPNIFPGTGAILSGGNFHAQPVALALDFLAIALAELGSISERRTYQLISGQRELPLFLTVKAGLHSGLMIPQYTAASIVSQNKQLCTPASVDSIVSSNGQEDHVSMAANAATKVFRVVENIHTLLAIEWLTAAQAIEFRRPAQTSPFLEEWIAAYRKRVSSISSDRIFSQDIRKTKEFLDSLPYQIISALGASAD